MIPSVKHEYASGVVIFLMQQEFANVNDTSKKKP